MNIIKKAREFIRLMHYWSRHPVGSRNIPGTILRFLRWQIGTRLLNYPIIVPWIGTTFLCMERGMAGATMNYYCGLHEFSEMAFLLHFLRPGDLFLDIGANIGSYSLLASGVCKARSLVLEPVPETYARLLRNIAVNGLSELVIPCRAAMGERAGIISFTADKDTMNHVAPKGYAGTSIDVPISTVDEVLKGLPESTFWKIDVEGHERQVFEGASLAMQNASLKAMLVESTPHCVASRFKELGFLPYQYEPFSRTLSLLTTHIGVINCLWVRDLEFVNVRLRNAEEINVLGLSF